MQRIDATLQLRYSNQTSEDPQVTRRLKRLLRLLKVVLAELVSVKMLHGVQTMGAVSVPKIPAFHEADIPGRSLGISELSYGDTTRPSLHCSCFLQTFPRLLNRGTVRTSCSPTSRSRLSSNWPTGFGCAWNAKGANSSTRTNLG